MKTIGVAKFGGPEQLQVFDAPQPHPGPGEVRIRVHAAAVNPTDTLLRAGMQRNRLAGRQPPYVPGMDAAGVVSEVGDAANWQVGDQVMAIIVPTGPHGGAYAEHVVAPTESVVRMPAGTDFVTASTVPMNGLTAWLTLDRLGLAPGQTLAVTGAAGAYGGYVVQLAKARRLTVIADATERDDALVRGLGADDVVRRGDDVAERIRAVVPGGVDALADGSVQDDLAAAAVRDGGGFATVRYWDGDPGRRITVHKIMVTGDARNTAALDELRQRVEAGTLTPRVARTYPAAEAADAHRALEAGGTRGRLVLDFTR